MVAGQIGAVGDHVMSPAQRTEQELAQIQSHLIMEWTVWGKIWKLTPVVVEIVWVWVYGIRLIIETFIHCYRDKPLCWML